MVDAVAPGSAVAQGMQRGVVHARRGEKVSVGRVMPLRGEVGDDVRRVGRDRDRVLEDGLLPSARRFAAESHGAEQRPGASPKMTNMRPAVGRATLVKPDAGNIAVTV